MSEVEKPFDLNAAAEFLHYSPDYLYQLVHKGIIKGYKPSSKKLYFKPSELASYAYGNPVGGYEERAAEILNR